ncbi:hypothetical protein NS319_07200 [Sphingomonas sanguinis]|uniref:Uncharacterized protein n=1 Tax=Sphingomonas sanguinis TaxID=33051 RepID=A0A147I0A3_9SPHN|nr:hypothetical protein NS319_07200 [Sphingomonas sanguinis]
MHHVFPVGRTLFVCMRIADERSPSLHQHHRSALQIAVGVRLELRGDHEHRIILIQYAANLAVRVIGGVGFTLE